MLRPGDLQRATDVWIVLTVLLTVPWAAVAQAPAPPASTDTEVLCVINGNPITRANLNKAVQQEEIPPNLLFHVQH